MPVAARATTTCPADCNEGALVASAASLATDNAAADGHNVHAAGLHSDTACADGAGDVGKSAVACEQAALAAGQMQSAGSARVPVGGTGARRDH